MANRDVTEERMQDDRVLIQVSDGEFTEHQILEAIFDSRVFRRKKGESLLSISMLLW